MNVFISYSWQDVPIRRAIVAELRGEVDIRVLFDAGRIAASDPLHPNISTLIDRSDLVIAILTSSGLSSKEVLDELVRANERKKRILPLVEQSIPLEMLPHFLRDVLQIRFTNSSFDKAVDTLSETVSKLSQKLLSSAGEPSRKLHSDIAPSTVKDFASPDLDWLQRSNLGRELLEQVIAMCAVYQFSWSRNDSEELTPIFISPNTFIPDSWTRSFLKGILTIEKLKNAETIVEIGVGTGIVPIVLARAGFNFKKFYGFDIDTLATRVSNINASLYNLGSRTVFKGGGSIFEPERSFGLSNAYIDLVVANIPQVPSMSTGPIRDLFDYYHMPVGVTGRKRDWAMQGLWLVSEILEQAKTRLRTNGRVVLNIGGRPGKEHLIGMLSDCGYEAEIVHNEIIEQDPETDISALVHFERTQSVFYSFYSDSECKAQISARAAYERIAEGEKAFHELFVIEAFPTSV